MASIKGTNRNDNLTGTASADRIQGLGGNDRIDGGAGDDRIEGGAGDDWIVSGGGSDIVDGGLGHDTIDYGGWTGPVRVTATGYSTDTNGKFTAEALDAAGALVSTDTLSYVENIVGSAFNDYLHGDGGANGIWGGAGDDWIHGGNGDDRLYGGDGDDLIDVGNGADIVDGGAGIDTIYWAYGTLSRVIVDLAAGTISYPGYSHVDQVSGIENIRGNWGTKEFYGSDAANIIVGSDGSDIIDGRGGNDTLAGDWGRLFGTGYSTNATLDDTIRGGDGDDLLSGDYGANHLTGGAGNDTFVVDVNATATTIADFGAGDRLALFGGLEITAWAGADSDGDGAVDAQRASLSNGTAILFLGHASVPAGLADGSAVDSVAGNFELPEITSWSMARGWGGAVAETSMSTSSMEASIMGRPVTSGKITIKGTRGNDTIAVGESSVTVNGRTTPYTAEQVAAGFLIKADAGDDSITGGTGPDEIDGGGGNDLLIGGDGADKLLGGAGNDRLIDSPLDSTFDGGRGFDTLDFSGSPMAVAVSLEGLVYTNFTVTRDADGYLWLDESLDGARDGVIQNIEELIGSAKNDFLVGNQLENYLRGGPGDDIISGAGSVNTLPDYLFGDDGHDYLCAGDGNDELTGGAGADTFLFEESNNDGNYVIHDFNKVDGDKAVIQLYSGQVAWETVTYDGLESLKAVYGDDSITFVGVTSLDDISLLTTPGLYPGG